MMCRFKLRLRPRSMPTELQSSKLTPLPPGKTVVQVLADFMAYLMKCTEDFIKDTHPNILPGWNNMRKGARYILGHPNGWEGQQQVKMRRAAILAGLVPDTPEGRSRVNFVTEGEASLHYCIKGGALEGVSPVTALFFMIRGLILTPPDTERFRYRRPWRRDTGLQCL